MSIEQFLPPKTQKQYPRVLDVALFTTTIIYAFFGFFGYLFFKNRTQGIIFANLQCYKEPLDWTQKIPDNCDVSQDCGPQSPCVLSGTCQGACPDWCASWAPICNHIHYTSAQILSKMVKAAMACMITFNCKFRYNCAYADPIPFHPC